MRNIQKHNLEVPEMSLLIKDHKVWSEKMTKLVPSRPVVSGNKGANTHLSEIVSEILELVVKDMQSGEVVSTEEALFVFEELNNKIRSGVDITDQSILGVLGQQSILDTFDKKVERLFKTLKILEFDLTDGPH